MHWEICSQLCLAALLGERLLEECYHLRLLRGHRAWTRIYPWVVWRTWGGPFVVFLMGMYDV